MAQLEKRQLDYIERFVFKIGSVCAGLTSNCSRLYRKLQACDSIRLPESRSGAMVSPRRCQETLTNIHYAKPSPVDFLRLQIQLPVQTPVLYSFPYVLRHDTLA